MDDLTDDASTGDAVRDDTIEAPSRLLDLPKLLERWTTPLPEGRAGEEAMREFYADPVVINGVSTRIPDLTSRARSLLGALANPSREILDIVEAGQKIAVAFRLQGTHVGPLATSAGTLPASGKTVSLRIIDILTVVDGVISEVVMVADEVAVLNAVGVVDLGRTRQ